MDQVFDGLMERVRTWLESHFVGKFVLVATDRFNSQYVIGLAQQIAYNILFSIAPLLIFLTGCVSLLAQSLNREFESPAQPILDWIRENVPEDVAGVIEEPVQQAITADSSVLLTFGGLLALWSAKNAIASTMRGLNGTYGIREVRPFLAHNIVALLLTLGLVFGVLTISLLQLLSTRLGEAVAKLVDAEAEWNRLVEDLQWPISLAVLTVMMLVLHRFGPTFKGPFRWYLPGAVFTILGVIVATWGLGKYFEYFGAFSAYGAFGAVLAFILWLYIISLVILLGGLINAVLFETFPPAKRALRKFHESHPTERNTLDQLRREVDEFPKKDNGQAVRA
ncbi:MAG TPA: YihY/virulence factor BrkB family protein [Thermomicrobiales bacterium]|nr:YihY/virulence factor BrkB family protein [Thermomicrobiales bacterium]